ncbi:SDR family oxidoreductase [Pendulispora rubella]|uniref:SDR family oxidoreductase n=1 Tax=Pendulispora rubella TaxID=2741070 RepID=A0ABZ2L4V7_9BACT
MDLTTRRHFIAAGLAAGATACASAAMGRPMTAGRRERFRGKVVLITGATSGIGRAAALAFAREGANVGFCGRREALGLEVEREIRAAGGEATYLRADVRRADDVQSFVQRIAEKYGAIHAAFNNAGAVLFKPLHEITLEEWATIEETNVRGVFLSMKYEIPHLIAAGGGTIVITSSFHAVSTRPGAAAYAASKRAHLGIAQAAALDYGPMGIRINVLAPGITDTPMFRSSTGSTEEGRARAATLVDALHRVATAEEMAEAALWLASEDCKYLTGTSLLVDGGLLAGL